MQLNVSKELAALRRMSVEELRARHLEAYGEPNRSRNKQYLIKRIIYRLQVNAEGGLSERAQKRARELANEADLRTTAPRPAATPESAPDRTVLRHVVSSDEKRAPMPGSELRRHYKGRDIVVRVLDQGFEWEGTIYRSLTAVAKAVTGSHWNGCHFFGLDGEAR